MIAREEEEGGGEKGRTARSEGMGRKNARGGRNEDGKKKEKIRGCGVVALYREGEYKGRMGVEVKENDAESGDADQVTSIDDEGIKRRENVSVGGSRHDERRERCGMKRK